MAEGGPVERGKHKKSTSGLFLSLRLTKTCSGNWSTMVPPGNTGQSLAIPGRLASHNVGIALRHLATHLYDTYSQCQNLFPPKLHNLVNLVRLLVCNFKLFNFYPISQLDNPEAQDRVVVRHPAAGFSPYFCAYFYLLYSRLRKKGHRQVKYFQHSRSLLLLLQTTEKAKERSRLL